MWALLAAVRPGLRLFRVGRGLQTPHPVPPWPPCSVRALVAAGRWDPGNRRLGGVDGRGCGERPEDDQEEEEEEKDEAELLSHQPLLLAGAQRVCVLHPDVKGGTSHRSSAEWQVAEAAALVHTLHGWSVVHTMVVATRTPGRKLIFGKGNLAQVTETIRAHPEITSVFLNVEQMSSATKMELEAAWGVEVFDRFTLVLHIFRHNAQTREARLQVALAEIPLLRSSLKSSSACQDQPGRGSRYIMGSGESFVQLQQRVLKEREAKIKRALERLCRKRGLLRRERARRELPVVSVVGYTNCGKTTLIKALTGDAAIEPRDQLFATLDVTAHMGTLPSRMAILYVDTIGFLSQLPHGLIQSFSATLEDVVHSDVIIHVRDVSHPDSELQKASVLSTLCGLHLPSTLLDSMVEVHNKVDLVPGYSPPGSRVLAVSALLGCGLDQLKAALEAAVLKATGRQVMTLRIRLAGPQLSWLYKEAAVQQVDVVPEAGEAHVTVIMSQAAYGKFRKLFPD
ncbi:putative GTP-binding protein 6 isoform X1 [Nannospalax galili]|uniref:putative GTP-binding protein 6 isoform X1 n=2 Tax=Nannospalax galili TaxID=1026970 RepID=UPI0004ECFF7C|nr:putative GTP-binding protein 6 isoform X1 [Nannospalax galili]